MTETNLEKRLIGYARVSTYGQTLDAQLEQLWAAGCSSRNIYRETVTGARAERRELNRMLGKLTPGDVVTVTRIDRLARSTFDLFAIASSASWTPRRNSGHWRNRGPTPTPAPGACCWRYSAAWRTWSAI
jgi:predicted site-specific integrase-resolvase